MKDLVDEAPGLRSEMQGLGRYLKQFSGISSHLGGKWGKVLPHEVAKVDRKWIVRAPERDVALPPAVELRELLAKAKAIFGNKTNEEFTGREIRMLPYILLDKTNSLRFIEFLFSWIRPRLSKRSQFRRLLYVYLMDYSRSDPRVRFVRKELHDFGKQAEKPISIKLLVKNPYLLDEGADAEAAKRIAENGIASFLQISEFPASLLGSDFVRKAIERAFTLSVSGARKLELLYEMIENTNYKSLISNVISPCIIYVDDRGNREERQRLLELILKTLGDPRGNNSDWLRVTPEAKERVLSWLVEKDFDFFFGIIEKTATVTGIGKQMWTARRAFWEMYKENISASRIVLGYDARKYLPDLEREFGRRLDSYDILLEKNDDTSLLVFRIQSYVFIEVSHNGTLRIFDRSNVPVDIFAQGHQEIYYGKITKAVNVDSFRHAAGWQPKVRDWIYDHCGIWREEHQWRL